MPSWTALRAFVKSDDIDTKLFSIELTLAPRRPLWRIWNYHILTF